MAQKHYIRIKVSIMRKILLSVFMICGSATGVMSQVDSTDQEEEFDFSQFEPASEPAKSFCSNKVLGQTPTPLLSISYYHQLPYDMTAGSPQGGADISEELRVERSQQISLGGNFPLISRNNILINMNLQYQEQLYSMGGEPEHPLQRNLDEYNLRRSAAQFTIFKPLNERNFLLGQVGAELNGDYSVDQMPQAGNIRVPAALLYGWKPNDRLMYAFGASRTYLGGALNYVPIAYYFHTFRNEKWGIEALLPARGMLRYRFNSLSLMSVGFNVLGATYSLNNFPSLAEDYAQDRGGIGPFNELTRAQNIELRRSEIQVGLTYQQAISGFFWFNIEGGYRINYSYELDKDGDFVRFWDNSDYFMENKLGNPLYFRVGISYNSP